MAVARSRGFPLEERNPARASERSNHDATVLAALGILANGITATASSTYAYLGLAYSGARLIHELGRRGPRTAAVLADHMGIHAAAVSRARKDLSDSGFIENDTFGRLQLTDKGKAVWGVIAETVAERNRTLMCGLCEEDRGRLIVYLAQLQNNLAALAEVKPSTAIGGDAVSPADV